MKVIVTGGAGFIGHHTVRELLENGHDILVVDNLSVGKRANIPSAVMFEKADVLDSGAMVRLFSQFKPDGVLHLAARVSIRNSVEAFLEDAKQNYIGTATVLDAAVKADTPRFILASSMAVYGDAPTPSPIAETWPKAPASPYGISKLASEQTVLNIGEQTGINATVLRLFNTFGTGQTYTPYVGVITIFIRRLLAGMHPIIFGDGNQCRDFVYVKDVAQSFVSALHGDQRGVTMNIGTGIGKTVNELACLISEKTGLSMAPEYTPAKSEELRNSVADISLARETIGYAPRYGIGDKLEEVIESLKSISPHTDPQ